MSDRTMTPAVPKCGPTGKRRYRTEAAALAALGEVRAVAAGAERRDASRRREQRAYPCQFCGGWHLTAQGR